MLPAVRSALIAHARAAAPDEACGMLGVDAAGVICSAYPTRNAAEKPGSFLIPPAEHHRVLQDAEAAGLRIGGIYHSHPEGPAVPSAADLAGGADPDWVHAIVAAASGPSPALHLYRFSRGRCRRIGLHIAGRRCGAP